MKNLEWKRFLLLNFSDYYPNGGLSDVKHEFDTEEEALAFISADAENGYNELYGDYAYLFDCEERKVIWEKQ